MKRRVFAVIRKEFIHIARDFRSLIIILVMPVLMIALYGYGITLDMRCIRFAVVDLSRTPQSRALIASFTGNGFFREVAGDYTPDDAPSLFRQRRIQMMLVIPRDFAASLATQAETTVQVLVDATDANVGTYIHTYTEQVLQGYASSLSGAVQPILRLEPRLLYNPDRKSTHFFVPGLIAVLLMLVSALLTSITITRERESGTMEQILVSPIRPVEIVIGKVIPYITIGFADGALILASARILFGTPVHGSLLLLALLGTVYVFVALSFGLLVSTVARTQVIAMFMTVMLTILPTFLLSGFLFPVASMPTVLQYLSRIIPATYFLVIIRGVMLKGVGIAELWLPIVSLCAIGTFILSVAVMRFRISLE
ncbi:MAG: ABC transporter permease [Bacteroidota bacterium]|nr:ABC transporter permease [Bacteroidota bacterium]